MPAKPASIAAVAASRTSAHRAPKGSRSRSTFMDRPAPYVFVPEIMPLKPLERWAAVGPQDVAKRWQSTTVAERQFCSQSPFRLQLRPQFGSCGLSGVQADSPPPPPPVRNSGAPRAGVPSLTPVTHAFIDFD